MLYVVCYDVSCDAARDALSRRLLDFGVRIQESVFEMALDDVGFRQMLAQVSRIPLAPDDRVRAYKICADCVRGIQIYGPGEVTSDPDFWIVS